MKPQMDQIDTDRWRVTRYESVFVRVDLRLLFSFGLR